MVSSLSTSTLSTTTTITWLSAMWFCLCASLVHKYNDLIGVFFTFIGCFVLARVLKMMMMMSSSDAIDDNTTTNSSSINNSIISSSSSNTKKDTTTNTTNNAKGIKHVVGLLACSLSFWYLLFCRQDNNTTLSCTSGNVDDGIVDTTCNSNDTNINTKINIDTNGEFMALTICTGYLAFDMWYAVMNDCYPNPPSIWSIVQDAVTLTIFLVTLCCSFHNDNNNNNNNNQSNSIMMSIIMTTWVSYKTICILYELLLFVLASTTATTTTTTTTSATLAKTLDSSSTTTTTTKAQASTQASSSSSSNKWTVHGFEYDLIPFLNQHPGGKEAIELGRGRDCTALFESYHPFTNKHRMVLKKYRIPSTDDDHHQLLSMAKRKAEDANITTTSTNTTASPSPSTVDDPFYNVLKERVAAALIAQGIDPETQRTAPPLRILYYGWIAACLVVSGYAHIKGSILGSFLFGVSGWFIGALGHDAGHFSASRSSTLNDLGVWGMSLLCNPIMWQHQHTFAHHSHTNEFDADPDLHHFHLLLRVHKRVQQQGDFYKNQTYRPFVFFAYTFVVFGTCFWIPLDMLLTGALYGIVDWTDRHRPLRAFATAAHMVAYVVMIMIIPFFTSSSWYKALASVILHLSTSGLLFGIFSQINHLNEASLDADTKTRMESKRSKLLKNSWAAAQVETSNNFAPNSHLWHILSNGLNLQIEHHLFPSVNHSHLYRIAPVVEQTCKEYGVNYKCYRSWPEIMNATLVWLDQLAPSSEQGDGTILMKTSGAVAATSAAVKSD